MRSSSLTLTARYVFPVEGPPIPNGRITIKGGRIAEVGAGSPRQADLDLGNVAIVPGFVNAHTHLELSALNGQVGRPGTPEDEVAWLRRVVEHRRGGSLDMLREAV